MQNHDGQDGSASLSIRELVTSGHLWDVYSAEASFITEYPIIVKMFCPSTSIASSTEWEVSEDDARRYIANENQLFIRHLALLQGDVVPKWYGLYGGLIPRRTVDAETETWVAIIEDLGDELQTNAVIPWVLNFSCLT